MMPTRLRSLAAVAALTLAACAPRRPPPDLSLDPAALLAQVEGAGAAVTRVQGEARLRLDAPGARGTVPAFVAVERPDRLHVEALDFFGNPAATLVAAGGRLAIYDARARTFYVGAATGANVARLVPLPLSPERLVAILCGTPVLEGGPDAAEPGSGEVTLTLREGPRTATLRVGPRAALLRASFRGGAPPSPTTRSPSARSSTSSASASRSRWRSPRASRRSGSSSPGRSRRSGGSPSTPACSAWTPLPGRRWWTSTRPSCRPPRSLCRSSRRRSHP